MKIFFKQTLERKILVILEKQSDSKKEIEKEAPTPSHQSGVKQTTHKQEPAPKSGHTTPTAPPPSHHPSATPTEPHSHQESKSKKKGKKNKASGEQSSTRPTETKSSLEEKSPVASSKSQGAEKSPSSTKPVQKSSIKATSTGLPVVPPTAPRLEKATPYEFIQAWNSLKNVSELQPYADLLRQIPPKDLPQGNISNIVCVFLAAGFFYFYFEVFDLFV